MVSNDNRKKITTKSRHGSNDTTRSIAITIIIARNPHRVLPCRTVYTKQWFFLGCWASAGFWRVYRRGLNDFEGVYIRVL